MSFYELLYEAFASYFIGQCRSVSTVYNRLASYFYGLMSFGEGGIITVRII